MRYRVRLEIRGTLAFPRREPLVVETWEFTAESAEPLVRILQMTAWPKSYDICFEELPPDVPPAPEPAEHKAVHIDPTWFSTKQVKDMLEKHDLVYPDIVSG